MIAEVTPGWAITKDAPVEDRVRRLLGPEAVQEDVPGFLHVGVRLGPVELVEVDVIGPQSAQRVVERAHQPAPGGAQVRERTVRRYRDAQ
jgi:hypothetical protein